MTPLTIGLLTAGVFALLLLIGAALRAHYEQHETVKDEPWGVGTSVETLGENTGTPNFRIVK